MRTSRPAGRPLTGLAGTLVLACVLASAGPEAVPAAASGQDAAPACPAWTGAPAPSPGLIDNELLGVTVLSGCDAWAVGLSADGTGPVNTLTERWDGSSWRVVPSPSPGNGRVANLSGVDAVSATDAWAVGAEISDASFQALIERWDGSSWAVAPVPSLGKFAELQAVSAVSPGDAWAVGSAGDSATTPRPVILRWNGTTWSRTPNPPLPKQGRGQLFGVAATSASNAWAVGQDSAGKTLILRWNGTRWARVISPGTGFLTSVAATSLGNAWAVGTRTLTGGLFEGLLLHWNGTAWARVTIPQPGAAAGRTDLTSVTATSATSAWAVGDFEQQNMLRTLILRWDGHTWAQAGSPSPGDAADFLSGVAATSASNAWAVGTEATRTADLALAIRCC